MIAEQEGRNDDRCGGAPLAEVYLLPHSSGPGGRRALGLDLLTVACRVSARDTPKAIVFRSPRSPP
jgi:hypothetical protein